LRRENSTKQFIQEQISVSWYFLRNGKMEKVKFQIEFPVNSSKGVLFNAFSTPSGLSEWFCDDVNIKKDVHIFLWDGSEESARMLTKKREEFVKFRWLEDEEDGINCFFEFRIKIDDLTGDTAVVITDFAEEDEMEDSKELWSAQIDRLKQVLGA
jgi:uncharacterized protein YndB with AHSA1/START domain